MSIYHLDSIFHPRSVAVIGASERPQSIGTAIMRNLLDAGYQGAVYPINISRKTLWGHACHRSITDIGQPVDLAVITTPLTTVPRIIRQCVQAGVGGALIISSGGKESGSHGIELEKQIRDAAAGSPLRILGPNSLGVACHRCKMNVTVAHRMPPAGKLAFISQSGAMAAAIFDSAAKERIGFSYFVGLGSMIDVNFGDAIDYIGNDAGVSSIVMYMEQLSNTREFMSAARAVSCIKPIIALKSGRTTSGAFAATCHTGATPGEDEIYDAAFRRAGLLRVKTFEELFDCAELLAKPPRPQGTGLVIISNSGGTAVMAADVLGDYGVQPVSLAPETIAGLEQVLSPIWSRANPVDIGDDATPQRYLAVLDILLKAPEADGLLVMLSPHALNNPTETAQLLVQRLRPNGIPVITAWLGGSVVEAGREIMNKAGIPTYDSPERAVRAFMNLYYYRRNLEMSRQIPAKLPRRLGFDTRTADTIIKHQISSSIPWMGEVEAKNLLSAYGLPTNQTLSAANADQAIALAKEIGFPVALKIDSPKHAHKSRWGGVRLDLANEARVRQAFEQLMASQRSIPAENDSCGVTVQKMMGPASVELALGIKKNPDFGPMMTFGWGGIATDIAVDCALSLLPLNRLLARRMIEATRVSRLLNGFRDNPPADLVRLEEILIRLSQLATDFAEIEEINVNPLMVIGPAFCAVSARICVRPAKVPAPLHLVLAPYPDQYESTLEIPGAGPVQLRPIRPEDAPLMKDLFATLSSQSIYFRFFRPLKELPHDLLARLTQIDYDREIAMVAIKQHNDRQEEMLAVGRVIRLLDPAMAEFSILVGDRWHGKGVGAALLHLCLKIGKKQGVKKIWGTVLADNTQMLVLGRKLHFKIHRDPDSGEYELRMDLSNLPDDVF